MAELQSYPSKQVLLCSRPTAQLAVETKARTRVECIPEVPVLIREMAVPLDSRVLRFASFRLEQESRAGVMVKTNLCKGLGARVARWDSTPHSQRKVAVATYIVAQLVARSALLAV